MAWSKYLPGICMQWLMKTMENLSHESQCHDWVLKLAHSEYKCKVLWLIQPPLLILLSCVMTLQNLVGGHVVCILGVHRMFEYQGNMLYWLVTSEIPQPILLITQLTSSKDSGLVWQNEVFIIMYGCIWLPYTRLHGITQNPNIHHKENLKFLAPCDFTEHGGCLSCL